MFPKITDRVKSASKPDLHDNNLTNKVGKQRFITRTQHARHIGIYLAKCIKLTFKSRQQMDQN